MDRPTGSGVSNYALTAKDPKQKIWGISGGLGGLESGGLESAGLESGGLKSRATDFGSGTGHTWGSKNLKSEI